MGLLPEKTLPGPPITKPSLRHWSLTNPVFRFGGCPVAICYQREKEKVNNYLLFFFFKDNQFYAKMGAEPEHSQSE